ncbi:MAG: rhodanese-like domain-containing protein [Gemmatimonadaceae bacterium]
MAERSRAHRPLAILGGVLGTLAVAAGDPYPSRRARTVQREAAAVTAIELARWLRDGKDNLRLLDVRPDSQFVAYHIPGARRAAPRELTRRKPSRDETIVVYAESDDQAAEVATALRARGVADVRILRGGLLAWIEQIAEPRLSALPTTAIPADHAAQREQLELSRYFGGTPVVSPAPSAQVPPATAPLPSRRSEAAAVGRILRRGC